MPFIQVNVSYPPEVIPTRRDNRRSSRIVIPRESSAPLRRYDYPSDNPISSRIVEIRPAFRMFTDSRESIRIDMRVAFDRKMQGN